MTTKEAFSTYKKVMNFIASHCEEVFSNEKYFKDIIKQLPGLTMVGPSRRPYEEGNNPSFFDKCQDDYFKGCTNCDSYDLCTVTLEGVYMNVWKHYGILRVGHSFGFTDEDGYFNLCYANNIKGPDDPQYRVLKTYVDDKAFYEKLTNLNISDDGERWVLKRNGSELRYRSLDDLRSENDLDYQFGLEGITTAELQKHRYDHLG